MTIETMVEFKERLRMAMEHASVSRDTLAKRLRVTRVAIDKVLDGRSKSMSAENCACTAQFLGVDMFWLATGLGTMLPPPLTVREVNPLYDTGQGLQMEWPMRTVSLDEYRQLTVFQQGLIEGQIRNMLHNKSIGEQAA